MKEESTTTSAAPVNDENVIFEKGRGIAPRLQVGIPVFFEVNVKNKRMRAKASVLGWKEPKYIMTTFPYVGNRLLVSSPGAEMIIRYLCDGVVYGFTAQMIHKQQDPFPMWVLNYPKVFETKNLRRSPRIQLVMPVKSSAAGSWHSLDLSSHGALLSVDQDTDIDEQVTISFTLPNGVEVKDLPAKVMRVQKTKDENLIGVNFDDTNKEEIDKITQYIDEFHEKLNQVTVIETEEKD